jgi:hypothetical protein
MTLESSGKHTSHNSTKVTVIEINREDFKCPGNLNKMFTKRTYCRHTEIENEKATQYRFVTAYKYCLGPETGYPD